MSHFPPTVSLEYFPFILKLNAVYSNVTVNPTVTSCIIFSSHLFIFMAELESRGEPSLILLN
jgi:hypothetical protein